MAFALSCCVNENLPGTGGFDGPVSLTLRFNYKPLAEGLTTRGVNSDLDFEIRDLTVLFYDEAADEENGSPALVRRYMLNKDYITEEVKRDGSKTEPRTRQAYVTIDDIERNSKYRIYAVANVALTESELSTISEKMLRETVIEWPTYSENPSLEKKNPLRYAIPDAMFGYFSTGDQEDVIHHDNANRAEVINFDKPKIEIHAWMKRVVSRLTIGFDGSDLNEGVEIYIKSVHVKDAVKACLLGDDNYAGGGTDVTDLFVEDDGTDERLNLVYTDVPGAEGPAITKSTPAFPRRSDSDRTKAVEGGWNTEWYEYVHGNATDILNPLYNDKSTTLYFMENVQGKVANYNGSKEYPKAYDPAYRPGVDYDKDGMRCGTYVEVEAYYKNATTQGPITYRFMLGQNTTDDFNVVRNCHYKLTLSFAGDANKTDWHIEFEPEEDGPHAWFPIPDDSQWEQSWVWHAYNEAGEPVAEICKELVYVKNFANMGQPSTYYQVVTVYPVSKRYDPAQPGRDKEYIRKYGRFQYVTDLSKGVIAQILDSDTESEPYAMKAGGDISMLLRTQPRTEWHGDRTTRAYSQYAYNAITKLENGGKDNFNYVEVWSNGYIKPVKGKILMSVQSKDTYENNSYMKFESFPEFEYSDKLNYEMMLAAEKPSSKEFRIKSYCITDADGNSYPVVKILASYWSRKNLRTTHYFQKDLKTRGLPIFSYRPPRQSFDYYDTHVEGDVNGYDYDSGPVESGDGWFAYFERYPMYKICDGNEFLYNFFAASGTAPKDNSYKKESQANPWYRSLNGSCLSGYPHLLDQLGYLKRTTYLDQAQDDATFDTSELYDFEDPTDDKYNLPLAPEGWHALPTHDNNYTRPGYLGELQCDNQYLFFASENGERYMSETGIANWSWPHTSKAAMTKRNLSGLSLMPIPADWETNGSFITFDVPVFDFSNCGLYNGSLNGVVLPYWDTTINDDTGDSFPDPMFTSERDSPVVGWPTPSWVTKYIRLANMSYLPIRFVRNAYDYSVGTIEPETATNAQTKQER